MPKSVTMHVDQSPQLLGFRARRELALLLQSEVPDTGPMAGLWMQLRLVERRLGTCFEQPDDLTCAQTLGHQIRNAICERTLRAEIEELGW